MLMSQCTGQTMKTNLHDYRQSKGYTLQSAFDSVYSVGAAGAVIHVETPDDLKFDKTGEGDFALEILHYPPPSEMEISDAYRAYYNALKAELSAFNVLLRELTGKKQQTLTISFGKMKLTLLCRHIGWRSLIHKANASGQWSRIDGVWPLNRLPSNSKFSKYSSIPGMAVFPVPTFR